MKRLLLTIILLCAVTVASGSCSSAKAGTRTNMRKTVKTVKVKRAVKCKSCTAFKCEQPKKRYAKR